MRKTKWIILLCIGCFSLFAEMRVWTGADGTPIKGSYVRILLGKVQIRDEENKLHLIPVKKLSKHDAHYVEHEVAPEIDISCRSSNELRPAMEWTISGDKTTLYTFDVKLLKKSPLASRSTLTVELYVIAEEVDGDNFILMQRDASKFVFPDEKKSSHLFTVVDVPIRKYQASWIKSNSPMRGQTYLGYIVTILDSKGNLVAHDTNLGTQKWLRDDIPGAIEKLRTLAIEGRGSSYSRHFDQKIRKSRVPRIPWYKRTYWL